MSDVPDTRARLRELVLYIADRCDGVRFFGKTKLNKILFFADFRAFQRLGHAITGSRYIKNHYGPTPVEIDEIRDELVKMNAAAERKERAGDYKKRGRLMALQEADLSVFTGPEIAIVDETITDLADMTADEVSRLSHKIPAWELYKHGEEIPYFTALLADEPTVLTREEIEIAKKLGSAVA